jgi:4'-phosphopantetheinyl transferase
LALLEVDGQVHVWRADLERGSRVDERDLPPADRERAAQLIGEDARRRWLAARAALRAVLARYLDRAPAEIEFEAGRHGKPRLAGEGAIRFNLSHSGDLAAVAVASGREVGVDLERIDPERDVLALAPRALSPEDAAAVAAAPATERPVLFHAAWARREACAKCLGLGLTDSPAGSAPREEGLSVVPLDFGAGFAGALAVEGEMPPLRRFELEPQ